MDKDTRNAIERATQRARKLLEDDFAAQLEGDFDMHRDGAVAAKAGVHLSARQTFQRERIVAAIEHKRAAGISTADSVADYLRDAAFTTLYRFVALKMLEARELVQECITKGEQSAGYREFCGMAPGLPLIPDSAGYRLYIESLFDELSTEVKVLFDRRDPSSVLWLKRATFEQLLEILNATELACVWGEDETIGWVYQFFNSQDERKKMREESQAPRNSRELAVRNQFFTPRYVVQFLTDNTLGRIWYEMHSTRTVLAERCEYMVRKPGEEFAPRGKKDPRDLRLLDPACGSGHFLLYAFDLLLAIYEEAYADPDSPLAEATGKTLADDYPSLDALRKAVPGLVLAHNLHGVDIDPRCAQIAQLALWMRAQKAYRDFGISRAERPPIRRSNIVVAEPLVADDQIAREFIAKLDDAELERVFTSLVESLRLAGDMGLLLRIEQLVARQGKRGRTGDLFAPPEERIRAALARLATDDETRTSTRRRLFIEDAAQGIGLLSVAEKKFDTIVMNPPFGEPTGRSLERLRDEFPLSRGNILAHFVDRCSELLSPTGYLGAIISRTCFFLQSFVDFRKSVLEERLCLEAFADFGNGVLDATVETAACVWSANPTTRRPAAFFRQLRSQTKSVGLRSSICALNSGEPSSDVFLRDVRDFGVFPDRPYVYWIDEEIAQRIAEKSPIAPNVCAIAVGLQTGDDFRFLRTWWEVGVSSIVVPTTRGDSEKIQQECIDQSVRGRAWAWYSKTEEALPILSSIHLTVKWSNNGAEIRAFHVGKGDSESKYVRSEAQYFRPGLSYMLRSNRLVPYLVPAGIVPTAGRSQVYPIHADESWVAALLSSNLATAVARFRGEDFARPKFQNSMVAAVPYVQPSSNGDLQLAHAAIAGVRTRMATSMRSDETEVLFVALANCEGSPANAGWSRESIIGEPLELRFSALCGLTAQQFRTLDRDRREAQEISGGARDDSEVQVELDSNPPSEGAVADASRLSWLIGIVFGRFDPRLATGERAIPSEPEPFDPLPARSPGMYPEGEEPADRPDILVDDEGHEYDLAARARALAERVHIDAPENLRGWLAKEFFPLHIKMYSKSRRKAPIYWQLATPSASYSVWLYIHAFSKDTLFRVQNEYVAPKLAHEERRLESLTSELRDGATAAQRKALAAQAAAVEELRAFIQEVKHVAPLWNPNLDDGVIINFAPLWRLVPQNKLWQKALKSTWDALCERKYDWTHLAMHLWPEHVVPKCAKDRSLAIAHGLEDVFWVEGADGKWTARETPTRSVDELVHGRTSPAVKSALKTLVEAPAASGNAGRGRGGRRKTAVEEGNA
ncbi:BREX-1 system adenine-specific DNA-methyltransferase PglX [Paraburkholderia phenazinium]|uniref:site-specific DNA-methyltransferase (adenine-specific) n=1 Tax=Paraburkholderia phenazinium TaxID=60549 RepID=A0A1N6EQ75_9BURK|nr:BREX-1 system adenine-specific DNA-methyltransferase PglX [Paraburkholderia phenazinium]SIN85127.1 hypothetical protein SAMN05444168_0869 [Paraburkholderia phenazinium]